MSRPVILAIEKDAEVLANVGTQLTRRYDRDYGVECLLDSGAASRRLAELRASGAEVALVLAGQFVADELLDLVRRLHPHAKRALLVSPAAWTDPPAAAAVRTAMSLGRVDYYVTRPAATQDEVFHEAISDFLLDWARE